MDSIKYKKPSESNKIVRECITEALLRLMKKKDFESISITELTRIAGVGRVTFTETTKARKMFWSSI